jgi:predicted DNA-binding transcriptional regulator AlpA
MSAPTAKDGVPDEPLWTPRETAQFLRMSTSWLAKSRMDGNGPPFIPVGRSIRYSKAAVIQWMRMRQRCSTSEE